MSDFYPPESEKGNHEYKWDLSELRETEMNKKSIQMFRRIYNGNGQAVYSIGVKDNGEISPLPLNKFETTVANLQNLASSIRAIMILHKVKETIIDNEPHFHADYIIEITPGTAKYVNINAVVCGPVDAGKSTTVGVLTTGIKDNGGGKARSTVLRHRHEMIRGQTSDTSYRIIGFDEEGKYLNPEICSRGYNTREVISRSTSTITLIDLPGHDMYLNNTTLGFLGSGPEMGIVMVNSNSGISDGVDTAREDTTFRHIQLLYTYQIPFIIIMTMVDVTTKERLSYTVKQISRTLKNINENLKYFPINNLEQVETAISSFGSNFVPTFAISNVTHKNYDLLLDFLSRVRPKKDRGYFFNFDELCIPISHIYRSVKGVGIVLSGIINSGTVKKGDTVMIGPDFSGKYHELTVKGVQMNLENIETGVKGDHIALSFRGKFPPVDISKGMMILSPEIPLIAVSQIKVSIKVSGKLSSSLGVGAMPTGFIANRRTTFKIIEFEDVTRFTEETLSEEIKYLVPNREYIITLETLRPVFAVSGTKVLIYEGNMLADGYVI